MLMVLQHYRELTRILPTYTGDYVRNPPLGKCRGKFIVTITDFRQIICSFQDEQQGGAERAGRMIEREPGHLSSDR